MASKAVAWAERYRAAEEAKSAVYRERPAPIVLHLTPSRLIEIYADEYGRGPRLKLPGSEHEPADATKLLAFARAILDTYGDPDTKETTP